MGRLTPLQERLVDKLPVYDPAWPDAFRDAWFAWVRQFLEWNAAVDFSGFGAAMTKALGDHP